MKYVLVIVVCIVAYSGATMVQKCQNNGNGRDYDDLSDRVNLQNCTEPPCRARKDKFLIVGLKFTPEHDVKGLQTSVKAEILGTPLPFPGVDGKSACPHIYEADKKTKVKDCELKAGKDYYYENGFEVLRIYPRIKTLVHWELAEPNSKKNVICFEFIVKITN